MVAVIYRGRIPSEHEAEYRELWQRIAAYFITHRGALGSRLHRTADGEFLAYSCWPDKATRDASWPGDDAPNDLLPDEIKATIVRLKSLASEPFEETIMEVLEDKLGVGIE